MPWLEQLRSTAFYQRAALIKRKMVQARRERRAGIIFQLPPLAVPPATAQSTSLHLLTNRRDWLGALWSARTFLEYLGQPLPVLFHDDGTLTAAIAGRLQAFLPGAQVIAPSQAEAEANRRLPDFPHCQAARRRHVMTHKLLDAALFAPGPRYILLDSDLLFFQHPGEVAQWLVTGERVNLWNRDEGNSLNLTPEEARTRHGVDLLAEVNAGFGCVWRNSVDFQLLDDYFSYESVWTHPHRVEQTAYALLSGKFGGRLLSRSYLVDARRETGLPPGIVMKHYVGKIRDLFYTEGIGRLLAQGFIAKPPLTLSR